MVLSCREEGLQSQWLHWFIGANFIYIPVSWLEGSAWGGWSLPAAAEGFLSELKCCMSSHGDAHNSTRQHINYLCVQLWSITLRRSEKSLKHEFVAVQLRDKQKKNCTSFKHRWNRIFDWQENKKLILLSVFKFRDKKHSVRVWKRSVMCQNDHSHKILWLWTWLSSTKVSPLQCNIFTVTYNEQTKHWI